MDPWGIFGSWVGPIDDCEDVVQKFKYVTRFKEIEVYIEEGISSIEQHLLDMRNSCGKGVVIEDIEDGDVVKESEKAGDLCLLEWHGATEMGKEGKQGDTSTHASSSKVGCRDDENCCFEDLDDDEILIRTPWSDEGKKKIRAKRLSSEYEFINILFKIGFLINDGYEQMRDKLSKETEASKEEVVAYMNQTVDKIIEKVSQEDVGKGMGEPELEQSLGGELETGKEDGFFHKEIEVD